MDKNILPKAYVDKFTMAQYSAPPLSGPLVVKTFQKHFGKTPQEMFDSFGMDALNAASMGQVHEAYLNGRRLAVKIQYPGVADSIESDLQMVRPLATIILQLPNKDIDKYFQEVKSKLIEETDYSLELKRSIEISQACSTIPNLVFAEYLPAYSCDKILTMSWLEGMHLKEFLLTNPSQEVRNQIGQAMWEFYNFQMMRADGTLGIIDFGCVKEISPDIYDNFFAVLHPNFLHDGEKMMQVFRHMEYILPSDSPDEVAFFVDLFKDMLLLLARPFQYEVFDFSDDDYFKEIFEFGEALSKMPEVVQGKEARGSRHSLYINRTYFGLYSLLNELKANEIHITRPDWLKR
jgi:predicted unusual protein kinase regulating ubiquinone biosynthesis (AarF/ABC1/UbiB family)